VAFLFYDFLLAAKWQQDFINLPSKSIKNPLKAGNFRTITDAVRSDLGEVARDLFYQALLYSALSIPLSQKYNCNLYWCTGDSVLLYSH
jgi:hypothetical protein